MKNRLFVLLISLFCSASVLFAQASDVAILNPDTVNVCRGDTLQLLTTDNGSGAVITWQTTNGFLDAATEPNPRVIPDFSRYYVVAAGDTQDSVYVDVDVFVVPQLIEDTLICQGYPLLLITDSVANTGNTLYDWSPGDFLDDSTDVNSVYISGVAIDTVFTLISTAANGACADTQSVRVDIIRSDLDIFGEDTIFRCLGDEIETLEVSATPAPGASPEWFPSTGAVGGTTGFTYEVNPTGNVTYYVEDILNGCYQIDSVFVRIDSLPDDMTLTVDPIKDPYCQGDTFFITSPTYDVGDYPLITHDWTVAPGIASPNELYNAVFFAADSALVTRVTENGGCGQIDTVQINVIKPPILIFTPDPAMVCPGEELQINVTFDPAVPNGELEWEDPGNTLSCDDCLDPIATVSQQTTYMITVTAEGSDCTEPSEYSISIIQDQGPELNSETLICSGDAVRVITGGIRADYSYRITGGGIDSADPRVEVTPLVNNTTYTVVTTGECGELTDQVTFRFADDYTLTASGPDFICAGAEAVLTAQLSNDRAGSFVWTVNGDQVGTGVQITPNPSVETIYLVTFTDDFGCGSAMTSVTVGVIAENLEPIIVATIDGNPLTGAVFSGNSVTLTATNVPVGLNVTYEWSGNLSPATATGESIVVTVPSPGQNAPEELQYTLAVTTVEGGCVFTDVIMITIEESKFRIPELITPNGDGTNDIFRIFYGGEITDYTMTIFNRWGQKIFTSTNVDEAWDGTKDGTPQNTDTYLYVTKFRINGAEVEEDGQFSLIR